MKQENKKNLVKTLSIQIENGSRSSCFTDFLNFLVEYKKTHGNFRGITQDKVWGHRVDNIRQARRGKGTTRLTPYMIEKLDEIGFDWGKEHVKDWFNEFLKDLKKYYKKHGSYDGVATDPKLKNRVNMVRSAYAGRDTVILTQKMIDDLNSINFVWGRRVGTWYPQFIEFLKEYKKEHGSFDGVTSTNYKNLVGAVRKAYFNKGKCKYKLTQEMINELNELGFPWRMHKKDWFEEFYKQLIEYKKVFGKLYNIKDNKELYKIVKRIRSERNGTKETLNENQIKRLNDIDFPWEVVTVNWFDPFYEKLKAYKEKYGWFYGVTQDAEIGNTAAAVRQSYKGKKRLFLNNDMIEKLNGIGFTWEVPANPPLATLINKLIDFRYQNGSFDNINSDKYLSSFVKKIRELYVFQPEKLPKEIVVRLTELGFDWNIELVLNSFCDKLKSYKEEHGSLSGILDNPKYSQKVEIIRLLYLEKSEKLSQNIIDKIDNIGFDFTNKSNKRLSQSQEINNDLIKASDYSENSENEFNLELFIKKMFEYKQKNGSYFGITSDPEIGEIVLEIRRAYKGKGEFNLTDEIFYELNRIGFPWRRETYGFKFDFEEMYEKLIAYKQKFGNLNIKTSYRDIDEYPLGLKYSYLKQGKIELTEDQKQKLIEIGLDFNILSKQERENNI